MRERLGNNFSGRRIVDIGCLEGYFSIECALQGAEVLGIDGKLLNVRKCEFVRSVLGVERATFALGDAMTVTCESSGRFDAVLVLGLLYHLDDPYTFLANVAALCTGFAVIDTHVALEDQPERIKGGSWRPDLSELRTFTFDGRRYEGRLFREFPTGTARDVKDLSPTASLENELSVWLTEDSLVRMLHDVGFSGTEKVVYPRDGGTLVVGPAQGMPRTHGCIVLAQPVQVKAVPEFVTSGSGRRSPASEWTGSTTPRASGPFHGLQHCDRE